jgi:hypothetical protein
LLNGRCHVTNNLFRVGLGHRQTHPALQENSAH